MGPLTVMRIIQLGLDIVYFICNALHFHVQIHCNKPMKQNVHCQLIIMIISSTVFVISEKTA